MKQKFAAEVQLIESSGGVFEVTVEGELIFSKKATGQFPVEDQLLEELATK